MLDPVKFKDWEIAEEAEKNLPSVEEFREKMGLLPDEIIPYGKTPKLDFIKIMNRLKDRPDGKYIEVKFKDVVKKFVLPGCIADKYLEVDDEDVYNYYVKCDEAHKKRMETELKIKSATYAIQRHEDAIEKLNAKYK